MPDDDDSKTFNGALDAATVSGVADALIALAEDVNAVLLGLANEEAASGRIDHTRKSVRFKDYEAAKAGVEGAVEKAGDAAKKTSRVLEDLRDSLRSMTSAARSCPQRT